MQLHPQDLRLDTPRAHGARFLDEDYARGFNYAHEALVGLDVPAISEGVEAPFFLPLPQALIFPLWKGQDGSSCCHKEKNTRIMHPKLEMFLNRTFIVIFD